MRLVSWLAMVSVVGVSSTGCSSLAKPHLATAGPVEYQQRQAERFDPFPDNNLGPAIVGGRPREFDAPREPLPLRPTAPPPTFAPAPFAPVGPAPGPAQ